MPLIPFNYHESLSLLPPLELEIDVFLSKDILMNLEYIDSPTLQKKKKIGDYI